MDAAHGHGPAAGTGMVKIIGDCERIGRVTGENRSTALRRLESALGSELAGRLVGALAVGHRARGLFF
jgi:hypothetical protein